MTSVLYLVLQLTTKDAVSGKSVIMEDSDSNSDVLIGEIVASDYTLERVVERRSVGAKKVIALFKSVMKPQTLLPFKVLCKMLGEGFVKS